MSDIDLTGEEWEAGVPEHVGVTRQLGIPDGYGKLERTDGLRAYPREFIKVRDKLGRHVAWVDVTDLGLIKAREVAESIADLPELLALLADVEVDNRRAEKGEKF